MTTESSHHQKDTIREEFNAVAPAYESNRLSPWYKAHADELLAAMKDDAVGDILDIGCGPGYLLRQYLSANPGNKGLGVDIAPNMTRVATSAAKEANIAHLEFIADDWEAMNLDSIDLPNLKTIVCANAFHYFADPQAATNKMAEALAHGKLYILERDKSRSLLTLFWDILHRTVIKDHVVFYDKAALFDILGKAGFENITVEKHLKRYFWKGKLFTNVILISCEKPL